MRLGLLRQLSTPHIFFDKTLVQGNEMLRHLYFQSAVSMRDTVVQPFARIHELASIRVIQVELLMTQFP